MDSFTKEKNISEIYHIFKKTGFSLIEEKDSEEDKIYYFMCNYIILIYDYEIEKLYLSFYISMLPNYAIQFYNRIKNSFLDIELLDGFYRKDEDILIGNEAVDQFMKKIRNDISGNIKKLSTLYYTLPHGNC